MGESICTALCTSYFYDTGKRRRCLFDATKRRDGNPVCVVHLSTRVFHRWDDTTLTKKDVREEDRRKRRAKSRG